MLWCERVAPLGKPVVPEVYWMLIGSSGDSSAIRATSSAWSAWPPMSTSRRQLCSPPCTDGSASGSNGSLTMTTSVRPGHSPRTCSIIER